MQELEKNNAFLRALELFEGTSKNIFLTGRAGTGKSTLLQYFRSTTKKNLVVLAPTGVAAVNVKGQTIHSFFRFRGDITPESVFDIRIRRAQREIYRTLDTIIIDEISMVRADLFDCIDVFLRLYGPKKEEPFGGVQLILIGDLLQLPPVVTRSQEQIFKDFYQSPWFFDAKVFSQTEWEFLELETIYRQKEDRFIRLLNAVRDDCVTDKEIKLLNTRYIPYFEPPKDEFFIYLTTTNSLADAINQKRLQALPGKIYQYTGETQGVFEEKNLPTQEKLALKMGAQVMLLNNDTQSRWVNGSIGQVVDIIHQEDDMDAIRVLLENGQQVDVSAFTWEMYRFIYDEESKRVVSEITGTFVQYPLRLAWAVTIHKSQGKTFSKVIIDIGSGTFSHGQIYVALSRAISFEGVYLRRPLSKRNMIVEQRVVGFLENMKKNVRKSHLVLQ